MKNSPGRGRGSLSGCLVGRPEGKLAVYLGDVSIEPGIQYPHWHKRTGWVFPSTGTTWKVARLTPLRFRHHDIGAYRVRYLMTFPLGSGKAMSFRPVVAVLVPGDVRRVLHRR